uniref:Uncharacterized protein n=1 Tax=Escherichia virus LS3 TaxID=2743777 RepID=A0A7D5G6J9_9CAUD
MQTLCKTLGGRLEFLPKACTDGRRVILIIIPPIQIVKTIDTGGM